MRGVKQEPVLVVHLVVKDMVSVCGEVAFSTSRPWGHYWVSKVSSSDITCPKCLGLIKEYKKKRLK